MDNFAQCSDFSLKRVDMIANSVKTSTANDLVGISTNKLKGVSRGNTHHSHNSEAAPTTTKSPFTRVNLEDKDIYRHWSPKSQKFVGGDTLLTALESGWEITGSVLLQEYACISNRCTYVYHLELQREWETISIKVIENPCVMRMLRHITVKIG